MNPAQVTALAHPVQLELGLGGSVLRVDNLALAIGNFEARYKCSLVLLDVLELVALAELGAELAAVTLAPPTPAPLENTDDDDYMRCLYCNEPYGKRDTRKLYSSLSAACGCRGVGFYCAQNITDADNGFRNAQCNIAGANPHAKCYKCRKAESEPERK